MNRFRHVMPFGAQLEETGVRFRLWAPSARGVELQIGTTTVPMTRLADGWYEQLVAEANAGTRYMFRIDGATRVPDPASRWNPDDVHGPSVVTDPWAFAWKDADWQGRPWEDAVIYELHIGAFTPAGTFQAAIERLGALVALGVTAIELMPVADFPGRRNWGYDGVLPFAPDSSYGTPPDLKELVQAAHARGLMMLLDVVYNHFGPDGNYLHVYAEPFFNPRHQTPWGAAINFDGERADTVRSFFVHNALYWLEEFRFDGLRLDAVHAIADDRRPDIIEELTSAVQAGPGRTRRIHIVLENDHNTARYLRKSEQGAPRYATAQWNDDVHHAAHVLASGESDGYYVDYAKMPLRDLGRGLAEGFVYQSDPSVYRDGQARGDSTAGLPITAFVNYLQTHDQVGNRAFGDRLHHVAPAAPLRALVAALLLAPSPPLLFMGEEFGASSPFQFFCDFRGDLAAAVTAGRRNEFGRFARFADEEARARIPDPNDPATFERSKLKWAERERPPHAQWLAWYTRLLQLRQQWIVPRLSALQLGQYRLLADDALLVQWPAGGEMLQLLVKTGAGLKALPPAVRALPASAQLIFPTIDEAESIQPWTLRWSFSSLADAALTRTGG
ncbi:MAG TPA: malto-oligosyltrehalose trehalohydrolase [Burkholderiaceae bacterium]|nr:malto-oligosyltrehalose trehalohydrolase [Burkholderiaceae bacterium]